MSKIQQLVDKLRTEYQTDSIVADVGKKGKFNRFSEESKRTIQKWEILNCMSWEIFPKTVLCQAYLNYALEGLLYCPCGVCFIPSPEQKRKIKTQFETMSVPFNTVREYDLREAKHRQSQWQCDH